MEEFDYAIVGGGIAGVSVAYWLTRLYPTARVILLEKSELAFGATRRNAGFLTCGSVLHFKNLLESWGEKTALEIWRFCETNVELCRQLFVKGHESLLEWRDGGSYTTSTSQDRLDDILVSGEKMKRFGLNVDLQPKLEGVLRTFPAAVHFLKDGSLNSGELVKLIATQTSAKLLMRSPVTSISPAEPHRSAGGGWLVTSGDRQWCCDHVIICGNGYSGEILPRFETYVRPIRAQIFETEPVPWDLSGNVYVSDHLVYFRQTTRRTLLLGGMRLKDEAREIGTSDFVNPIIHRALEDFMNQYLGGPFPIKRRWSGVMGFSTTGLPVMGEAQPHLHFLGGFSSHGMGMAFHCAKVLVESFTGGQIPHFLRLPKGEN